MWGREGREEAKSRHHRKISSEVRNTNRNEGKPKKTGRGVVVLTRATWLERVWLRCEKSVRFNKWFASAGDATRLRSSRRESSPASAERLPGAPCPRLVHSYTLHWAAPVCVPVRTPARVCSYDAPTGLAHRWARADLQPARPCPIYTAFTMKWLGEHKLPACYISGRIAPISRPLYSLSFL